MHSIYSFGHQYLYSILVYGRRIAWTVLVINPQEGSVAQPPVDSLNLHRFSWLGHVLHIRPGLLTHRTLFSTQGLGSNTKGANKPITYFNEMTSNGVDHRWCTNVLARDSNYHISKSFLMARKSMSVPLLFLNSNLCTLTVIVRALFFILLSIVLSDRISNQSNLYDLSVL